MEFLKTYDRNHNFVEIVSRQKAHEKNYQYYHQVVHIIVKSTNNKILVQKRSKDKTQHPNMYDLSVTGHVSFEDDLLIACQREMSEEIGISLNKNDFKFIKTVIDDKNKEFINIFVCNKKFLEDYPFVLQQEEVECVQFISSNKFINLMWSNEYVPYFAEYKKQIENIIQQF